MGKNPGSYVQRREFPSVVLFIDIGSTFNVQQNEYLHSAMVLFEAFRIEACLRNERNESRHPSFKYIRLLT